MYFRRELAGKTAKNRFGHR